MKKVKIKFTLSLIFLICSIIIAFFYSEYIETLEKILIPIFFVYFIIDSFTVLFPSLNFTITHGKLLNKFYIETTNNDKALFNLNIRHQNRRSLYIFLIYFGSLTIIGILYTRFEVFKIEYLYILFFFINFADYFSIIIWCPFKSLILKNICCNRCRIANWDRLMKFYILLFIPSFYSITLVLLGITIFIIWEYSHYKHPERFYSLSNKSLSCKGCLDSTCKKNKE